MRVLTTACEVPRSGLVLPTTRMPSTKQSSKRAAEAGSNAIGQRPLRLRTHQCCRQPCLHHLEEPPDALLHRSVMAANSMAVATTRHPRLPLTPAGAINITGETGAQTRQGIFPWIELSIEPRQSIVDIAVEGTQKEPVLVPKGGIQAPAREFSSPQADQGATCRDSRTTRKRPLRARQCRPDRTLGGGPRGIRGDACCDMPCLWTEWSLNAIPSTGHRQADGSDRYGQRPDSANSDRESNVRFQSILICKRTDRFPPHAD